MFLFRHELSQEGYQSEIRLDGEFADFKAKTVAKARPPYAYVTRKGGFDTLLFLAHVFFKTPLVPSEWRNSSL